MLLALGLMIPTTGVARADAAETQRGVEIQAEIAEGLPIGLIYVHVAESTGDSERDEALRTEVADAFGVRKGGTYRRLRRGRRSFWACQEK